MAVPRPLAGVPIPPIPACIVETIVNDRGPVLFWIRNGRARVEMPGTTRELCANEALWIPAGVPHRIVTESGTVAFPILPEVVDLPANLDRVVQLAIPPSWEKWLIVQFALGLGYLREEKGGGVNLLDLMADSHASSGRGDIRENHPATRDVASPPLPISPAAAKIAAILLQDPGDDTSLDEFAGLLKTGLRTIQRQFSEETGLSFRQWRTKVRVAAAAAHLDAGRSVGWAGRRVGFATPAGFTRAFRQNIGTTPRTYSRTRYAHTPSNGRMLTNEISSLSRSTMDELPAPQPPPIPAARTWARVNDFHIIVWVYRGTARVRIGEQTRKLRRGDALWLPAGVHNSIDIDANSIVLPLGGKPGTSPASLPTPHMVHLPLAAENWLLHSGVAAHTLVRPEGYEEPAVVRLLRQTSPGVVVEPHVDPVQRILATVRNEPSNPFSLTEWAERMGVAEAELRDRFIRVTGQTYPLWRADVRMTVARQLLDEGIPSGEVGRRLGYSYPSGFTQAFVRAHGISPRAYQRRHAGASRMTRIPPRKARLKG
ncbi:MAG: helix-turn-helix domain-containing protein [Ancrocorticia sp.]